MRHSAAARPGPRARVIRSVTDRPGHDFRYGIDPSLSETALARTAPYALAASLARTIGGYLANRTWWQQVCAERYAGQTLRPAA